MNAQPTKQDFDRLVKAMSRTKIPCTITLGSQLTIQLGNDWTKRYRIYNRVYIILERLGMKYGIDEMVSLCARQYSNPPLEVFADINGGVQASK